MRGGARRGCGLLLGLFSLVVLVSGIRALLVLAWIGISSSCSKWGGATIGRAILIVLRMHNYRHRTNIVSSYTNILCVDILVHIVLQIRLSTKLLLVFNCIGLYCKPWFEFCTILQRMPMVLKYNLNSSCLCCWHLDAYLIMCNS